MTGEGLLCRNMVQKVVKGHTTQSGRPETPRGPWVTASVAGAPSYYCSALEFNGAGAERLESTDMLPWLLPGLFLRSISYLDPGRRTGRRAGAHLGFLLGNPGCLFLLVTWNPRLGSLSSLTSVCVCYYFYVFKLKFFQTAKRISWKELNAIYRISHIYMFVCVYVCTHVLACQCFVCLCVYVYVFACRLVFSVHCVCVYACM